MIDKNDNKKIQRGWVNKRAFSLIELMVAVSVLAIGVILIARSFLSASNALSNGNNRILALNFLDGKMSAIEEEALKGGDSLMDEEASAMIGPKTFIFKAWSDKFNIDGDSDKDNIKKVTLSAEWKEGNITYDEIIGTYIELAEKE